MARDQSREIIHTPEGKRLKIVETETTENVLDRDAVDRALLYLDGRIAHLTAQLAALQAERDDLAAKRDLVEVAPREGGQVQV